MRRLAKRYRVAAVLVSSGFRAAPGGMTLSLLLLIVSAACWGFFPLAFRIIVDAFLAHRAGEMVFGVVLVAVLQTVNWSVGFFGNSVSVAVSNRTNLYMSKRIATLVQAAPGIEHFERPEYLRELELLEEKLDLLSRAPREVVGVLEIFVRLSIVLGLLGAVYWPLAFLPLLVVFPLGGERLSVKMRERSDERLAEQRRLVNELFTLTSTAGPAMELRGLFGLAGELRRRHREMTQEIVRRTTRVSALGGISGSLGWLVFAAGFVVGVATVTIRAAHHEATAGEVVLAIGLLQRTQTQVGQVANSIGGLLTMRRTIRRLLWLEDYVHVASPRPATHAPPRRLREEITLRSVGFSYPAGDTQVLSEVDLFLPVGTSVALVGENGAGKTTLVKLLTRMYDPDCGEILVDGVDLCDIDIGRWRSQITAGFQDFARFELLARETVGVGDLARIEDSAVVRTALERAGATEVPGLLEGGLEAPLGRSFLGGRELSGGQWQKLALARTMMRDDPLLLVLDEPTASLDVETEASLFDRFVAGARRTRDTTGAITLIISHRFSTVRVADLIVVLADGRVREFGSHAALIALGGTYAELFEMQARSYR